MSRLMTPAQASSQGSLWSMVQMASSAIRRHSIAQQGMRCWKKMKMMMLNSKSAMPRCVTVCHAIYVMLYVQSVLPENQMVSLK